MGTGYAVATKRVAPCQAPAAEPHTAPWSMQTDGFRHVVGAGWVERHEPGEER